MRFLLSSFGTAGDIIPFARLAGALLERGHTVTVHSWEHYRTWFPPRAAFVPAAGGVVAGDVDENLDWALHATSFLDQVRRFGRLFYGLGDGHARASAYFDRAREAFASHDLAVMNTLDHVGQAAAESIGLPWACYMSRPPPDPARGDALLAEVDAEVGDLLAAVTGVSRPVRVFRQQSPILTMAACSPHVARPHPSPSVELTGAWLEAPRAEPLSPAIEAFLAAGPVLLVTFGTMPDVNRRTATLIAAAERSGWRALIQVLPPSSAPAAPDGILVVAERLPFAALFPRVAAVVHHGSVGTVHEIIRAGKPSLVIPHMGDQFFWAPTLHELGLGPAPVHFTALDADVLALRLAALREDGYRRQAAALAPVVAAEDGVAVATARVEALARGELTWA